MSDLAPRWYGVSTGNGNDGVSQSYPDFYVYTRFPFELAEFHGVQQWRDEAWAREAVEVDGEAEYTISATFYEGPEGETQFGAAEMIVEVFPVDEDDIRSSKATYDGLTAALGIGEGIPPEPPYGVNADFPTPLMETEE